MKFRVIRQTDIIRRAQPDSRGRAGYRSGKWRGSIATSIASMSAGWPTKPCTATRTACCTSCAGGRAFITLAISPQQDLTESTLLDYLRFQSSRQPPPSASTINDRVAYCRSCHPQ